jgi:hypothetical protein
LLVGPNAKTHRIEFFGKRLIGTVIFELFNEPLQTFIPVHIHPHLAYEFWLKNGHPRLTGVRLYENSDPMRGERLHLSAVTSFASWHQRGDVWSVIVGCYGSPGMQVQEAEYLSHDELEALREGRQAA